MNQSRESSMGLEDPTAFRPRGLQLVLSLFSFTSEWWVSFLGRYLLDSEFVPTSATREILIVFLPVLLPAGGSKVGFPTRAGEGQTLGLGGLPGFAYATVSQDWTFFVQPKLRSSRARGKGLSFPGPPRLFGPPDCLKMRARYDKGPQGWNQWKARVEPRSRPKRRSALEGLRSSPPKGKSWRRQTGRLQFMFSCFNFREWM